MFTIGFRTEKKDRFSDIWWVGNLPDFKGQGDKGKDWGFVDSHRKVIHLNKYWQRRFKADCEYLGYKAIFIEIQD